MATLPLTQSNDGNNVLRVLLVEDSDVDRDLTQYLLAILWPRCGDLEIDIAGEGREALNMLHTKSYSLLLLDWQLPGMNGGRLLASLSQIGIQIPVVVLTGVERGELNVNLENYGAVYLHKDNLRIGSLYQSIVSAINNTLHSRPDVQPALLQAIPPAP